MHSTKTTGITAYCNPCANTFGILSLVQPLSSSPSPQQVRWMSKHLAPTSTRSTGNAIFLDPTTSGYELVHSMTASVGFAVRYSSVLDLVAQTTDPIAYLQHSTAELLHCVHRKFSTDPNLDHCHGVRSTEFAAISCAVCGAPFSS